MLRFVFFCFFIFAPFMLNAGDSFYSLEMKNLRGESQSFQTYKDKVVLLVNIASGCGYTPQLKGLQEIHDKYKTKGFVVLGFPSNDFNQESREGEEIAKFCNTNYGVNFPLFEKTSVKGSNINPVFKYLVENSEKPQTKVAWNFEKFLVNRKGIVVGRYLSNIEPKSKTILDDIKKALKE